MNKYYFEIMETEYTYNVISEVIGDIITFEGTEKEYNELKEYEVFELDTTIGVLFFHHEDIKLIGCYDMKKVNMYNKCVNELTNFNGRNSTYDEIMQEYNYNLDDSIMVLKSIIERELEESETTEQIKFYNEILSKINTIA